MNIAILTPITLEYAATLAFLDDIRMENHGGQDYVLSTFQTAFGACSVVLRETGSRNSNIAINTERIIQYYKPNIIILVGIGGGIKDVVIGDVVVGTQAYGYDSGKSTNEGFMNRPNVLPYSPLLLEAAKEVAQRKIWQTRIKTGLLKPSVILGPIASGDQVIASSKSTVFKRLKEHYNDTIALDMESIGFATSVSTYRNIHAINIRGISDLIDDKNAKSDQKNQPLAAAHAAAFTFELIYQLNPKQIMMDAKTIAKQIVDLLLPVLKLDSLKEIGTDFKEATNSSVKELWEKVKPIFIEEIEAHNTPEETKGGISSALRKEIQNNEPLKQKLENLLRVIQHNESKDSDVNIMNSKNVVQGSSINIDGDFRLGDN